MTKAATKDGEVVAEAGTRATRVVVQGWSCTGVGVWPRAGQPPGQGPFGKAPWLVNDGGKSRFSSGRLVCLGQA